MDLWIKGCMETMHARVRKYAIIITVIRFVERGRRESEELYIPPSLFQRKDAVRHVYILYCTIIRDPGYIDGQ